MKPRLARSCVGRCLVALALVAGTLPGAAATALTQVNLVSDLPGLAAHTDPNLKNPWGIAESASGPFWVANNHTGVSTLYNSSGTPQSLVVTIPPAPGSPPGTISAPTGVVFTGSPSPFGAPFVFATEDGTIAAWSGGTTAAIMADLSPAGASYTGLANTADRLFAANFGAGRIDVFDTSFGLLSLGSVFTDPNLPAGYSPFGIRNIGGDMFVTYAINSGGDEQPGAGLGIVDVFDTSGNLERRLINPGGALNAPWGLAVVPAGFGAFEGDLLVGNFGDGTINAFDRTTGAFLGTLSDAHGNPIVNDGLWALQFGNGGNGGLPDVLYITAGINDEANGLFAAIFVPEPGTLALVGAAIVLIVVVLRRRSR